MLCTIVAALSIVQNSQTPTPYERAADEVFKKYGNPDTFPPLMRKALSTFIEIEQKYAVNDYRGAKRVLDNFWKTYPPATEQWREAYAHHAETSHRTGINIGIPSCYYALLMYSECINWRIQNPTPTTDANTATLTIVLVGNTEGTEPSNKIDLANGAGNFVKHSLDPQLANNPESVVGESVDLFREYIYAASKGKLAVKTKIVRLDEIVLPVSAKGQFAGLSGNAIPTIWKSLPKQILSSTDWWWIIYPSNVPEQYPDFKRTEFITGGMGTGPDGNSPCFISDDRWLTRKPPHLGTGKYTSTERRAYLPQWLQHEMAHHWFRVWPEFELETKSHQWFDRSTWPSDFVGFLEPDYYANALKLRIQREIASPMHIALLYAPPEPALFQKLEVSDVLGRYEHKPKTNEWHSGRIFVKDGEYFWENDAGINWKLTPSLGEGRLYTGSDCPYADPGSNTGPPFIITLKRDARGKFTPSVKGFSFGGGFYTKL